MTKLTAAARRKIPAKDFALGKGHYPIEDEGHARAALSMGAQHASPGQLATIKRKVHAKYPGIKVAKSGGAVDGEKMKHRPDRKG